MSNVDKLKYNGVEYDLGKSIDASLTQSGQPADAKEVGDKLNSKVDKIDGKGLSSNDYTTDEKTKLAGIESGANKTLIDTTLVNTGQAADAKSVGDAIASQNTNINAIKKRTDNVESNITTLQNNKVDMTTPLLNFDDTATDPLTDDGALANALRALDVLDDVIPTGGGSLYLKKALTKVLNAQITEDFSDKVTYSENFNIKKFYRCGNVITFHIQGDTITRPESTVLFTLPDGYRPQTFLYFIGTVGAQGSPTIVQLRPDGGCIIYLAPSYPTGRLYLSGTFML